MDRSRGGDGKRADAPGRGNQDGGDSSPVHIPEKNGGQHDRNIREIRQLLKPGTSEVTAAQRLEQAYGMFPPRDTPSLRARHKELHKKLGYPNPYTMTFEGPQEGQRIMFVAMRHLTMIRSPEEKAEAIRSLGRITGYYMRTTPPERRLIIYEGVPAGKGATIQERIAARHAISIKEGSYVMRVENMQKAAQERDEGSAMVKVAYDYDIPAFSPEPFREEVAVYLKAQGIDDLARTLFFAKQDVYTLTRHSAGEVREQRRFTIPELYESFTAVCRLSGWQEARVQEAEAQLKLPLSQKQKMDVKKQFVDGMLPFFNQEMQSDLNVNLVNEDYSWALDPAMMAPSLSKLLFDPPPNQEKVHKIVNLVSDLRERFLLKGIWESFLLGYSPLVVFGTFHAIRLEGSLTDLYGEGSLIQHWANPQKK